jgi:hypothetical protein
MSEHEAWSRQLESYERAYEALAGEYAKLLRHVEAVMIERAEVADERDRLRAVVDAVLAMWDDLTAVDEDGTHYQFPAAHYAPIDDGLDALGLLDVSPNTGGEE